MGHPISDTPSIELVQQWRQQWVCANPDLPCGLYDYIAAQAAQWGWDQRAAANEAELQQRADQELEACCEWLKAEGYPGTVIDLRAARRPKPLSLRKQAYDALDTYIYGEPDPKDKERTYNTIRQALEALPND